MIKEIQLENRIIGKTLKKNKEQIKVIYEICEIKKTKNKVNEAVKV